MLVVTQELEGDSEFRQLSGGWPVSLIGAGSGAGLKDPTARIGHDSERAAMIYQHEARGADSTITDAINAHIEPIQRDDDGIAGVLVPVG